MNWFPLGGEYIGFTIYNTRLSDMGIILADLQSKYFYTLSIEIKQIPWTRTNGHSSNDRKIIILAENKWYAWRS